MWLSLLVPIALMAVVAWFARRQALWIAVPGAEGALANATGTLSWLSFATMVIVIFVPLAATLYLTVSGAWTSVERTLLRRQAAKGARADSAIRGWAPSAGPRQLGTTLWRVAPTTSLQFDQPTESTTIRRKE